MDVHEAAAALGISAEAVRKRLRRGTLTGRKVGDEWDVLLPEAQDAGIGHGTGRPAPAAPVDRGDLVDQLQREVDWLRSRLEAAEVERSEMRRLLGNAQQQLMTLLPAPVDVAGDVEADRPADEPPAQATAQDAGRADRPSRLSRWAGRLRGRRHEEGPA